jgi:hypothetical protein
MHSQTLGGESLPQAIAQVPVQLDNVQAPDAVEQRDSEHSQSGPDFDDVFARLRVDCTDDTGHNAAIDEEVLAESLPRNVPGRHHAQN